MAIYIWKCKNCGHEQKIERPMSESDIPPESCDGEIHSITGIGCTGWIKVWTPASFVLKGGGWYKDGYQKPKTPT